MNNLNSILIEGNLVRDPEYKIIPSGISLCNFSIATDRFIKREESFDKETSFFDIEVWSKLAEICNNELKKGRGVRIVGRLQQDRWVDSEGKSRSKVKVIAEHVEFKPQIKREFDGELNDEYSDTNNDIPF
jgi:single-strand DNA-binding protein